MVEATPKMALVTQSDDIVTVTQGEVPFLCLTESTITETALQITINSLRAGAPKVQILHQHGGFDTTKGSFLTELTDLIRSISKGDYTIEAEDEQSKFTVYRIFKPKKKVTQLVT